MGCVVCSRPIRRPTIALGLAAAITACSNRAQDECGVPSVAVAANLRFSDVTMAAGISHVQATQRYAPVCPLLEVDSSCGPSMTGGAAAGDFDGDGWVDLFVTRWDQPSLLYRNLGNGTFVDVAAQSGIDPFLRGNGAAFADIDNDGDQDLFVTTLGATRFRLYVNRRAQDGLAAGGLPRFVEEAVLRGVDQEGTDVTWGFSPVFGDYDRDGWLDLHTTEWRQYPAGARPGGRTRLFHNRGAVQPGYFADVTEPAGVSVVVAQANGGFETRGFASGFADLDDDGFPELLVAADFGQSRLFWNNGAGAFLDGTAAASVNREENAMGHAIGDYDGDGKLDWFVTSVFIPGLATSIGNRLYRNLGNRTFADTTETMGVKEGYWGWGTSFFDPDNDGDLDLVMTNGMDFPNRADQLNTPMRYFENRPGLGFLERSAEVGLTDRGDGKGLLVFDFDRDGDEDIFIANAHGPAVLYRNDGTHGAHFLRIVAEGVAGNRDAIGLRAELDRRCATPLVRTLSGSNNFLGQNESVIHLGLGQDLSRVGELRLRWPSGARQTFSHVSPDQVLRVREPRPN